ncbi:MAG: transporter substrate-binding domain-containing protein [Spirochaetota bacterium]
MKRVLCLSLVLFFSLMLFAVQDVKAETKVVKMQFFDVSPHVFFDKNNGRVTGAVYDLIENYIAKEMGVKFVWDNAAKSVQRQMEILGKEQDHASALIVFSPERSTKVDFTAKPYFIPRPGLGVLNESKLKTVKTVSDLNGFTIGYATNTYITPFMKDKSIKFDLVGAPNFIEVSIKKAMAKRVDAAYAPDAVTILFGIKQLNLENKFRIIYLPEKPAAEHIVFSKNSKELVAKYNQAFEKLDVQKLYFKLLSKYVDTSKL